MDEYVEAFNQAGITYEYCLIDDAVSKAIKNEAAMYGPARTTTRDLVSAM